MYLSRRWQFITLTLGLGLIVAVPMSMLAQSRRPTPSRPIVFQPEGGAPKPSEPTPETPLPPPPREPVPRKPNNAPPRSTPPKPKGNELDDPLGPDPTRVRDDLRPILDPPKENAPSVILPGLTLAGRISLPSGKTTAMLRVGESYYLIDEDSIIGIEGYTLNVKKLTATQAVLEVESLGISIQLR